MSEDLLDSIGRQIIKPLNLIREPLELDPDRSVTRTRMGFVFDTSDLTAFAH